MKIIFLVPVVPPVINGIGEYTYHLVQNLRNSGVDAHIVTSCGQKQSEAWIHPVIKQWNLRAVTSQLRPMKPEWVSLQYVPQLYHPRGLCWNISGIPAHLKNSLGCKITVTFHEFSCAWSMNPKKFMLALFLRVQTYRLLKSSNFAVTTCEVYRGILLKFRTQTPVFTIPVGANIPPEPYSQERVRALKSQWGTGEAKIFSVFGRLSNFRSHDIALEILERTHQKGVPSFLLLIGCMRASNPEMFKSLMAKIKEKKLEQFVIETGDLSPQEVSFHLSASDIFLFPQADGISTRNTTLISALAHGLPIVSYQPSAGNFLGKPIPYAGLAAQGHPEAFIEKALHFASLEPDDKKAHEQMNYYQTHFSWESIADAYNTVLMKPL